MARCLGANLSFTNLITFIQHPETNEKVYILLDATHMLKLCRNTLGDWKTIYDGNDKVIQWKYFEELVSYQDRIGLHAGTKISNCSRHISYHKEKTKVRLAAQTFSMSVANALTFCSTILY